MNGSEQVVLNCTVSSSPDPVYNWSIPDTCSSCPHTNNDSVMIFTADITDSGKYVCTAGNQYGTVTSYFDFNVVCKEIYTVLYVCMPSLSILLLITMLHFKYPVSAVSSFLKKIANMLESVSWYLC